MGLTGLNNMEKITFDVNARTIVVMDGATGKLWYQAPGLEIYVNGSYTAKDYHRMHYQAALECQARHIPQISLKCVRCQKSARTKKINPKQKGLF